MRETRLLVGCSGIYCDPQVVLAPEQEATLGLRRAALEEMLPAVDVLSIHVPLTPDTRMIIDASAIARLKPGAIVVNTARGGIIDENALAAALRSGHVLATGLDVFEHEPPSPDNPLLPLPNTILTPHISAGTRDAMRQKMAAIFANLDRFFSDRSMNNLVKFP